MRKMMRLRAMIDANAISREPTARWDAAHSLQVQSEFALRRRNVAPRLGTYLPLEEVARLFC